MQSLYPGPKIYILPGLWRPGGSSGNEKWRFPGMYVWEEKIDQWLRFLVPPPFLLTTSTTCIENAKCHDIWVSSYSLFVHFVCSIQAEAKAAAEAAAPEGGEGGSAEEGEESWWCCSGVEKQADSKQCMQSNSILFNDTFVVIIFIIFFHFLEFFFLST